MSKKQFLHILQKYLKGNATGEERRFIESYYDIFEGEPELEEWLNSEKGKRVKEGVLEKIWERVSSEEPSFNITKKKRILPMLVKVAAAVLILLTSTLIIYNIGKNRLGGHKSMAIAIPQPHKNDIKPGGDHALLTLANGEKIILDSAKNGSLGRQGNTRIVKINNGLLKYNGQSSIAKGQTSVQYNTVSTPMGGKYEVVLPDGSKVWLNAASSLHFPVAFKGNTRAVAISGEAYFEVASQSERPFIVDVGNLKVEVLGTHFNIDAYDDENSIKTTLAEGAVKVMEGNKSLLLQPGEQASLDKETQSFLANKVNIDEALAWKNDLFYFDNTNITDIMQEIARWYNVEVVYKTKYLRNKNYSGIMSRYSDVNAILKRMELTGTVHFKVDGRTITVTN